MGNNLSFASQAEALAALFSAFPSDKGEGAGFAATYLMAIEGYSLRAVSGAVRRLIRGEVDDVDKRFLPTPAQLSNAAGYMEKLYAPPEPRLALPAPGDIRDESHEGIARREAFVATVRERFGIKSHKGEIITDREAIPEARRAKLDAELATVAKRISAEGLPGLSAEARALFREQAERAVPTPAEQFDEWDSPSTPLSTQDEKAA